ncbi:zinc finger protein 675-like [Littorina saxatilis]|uniref:zinc finger protein 675-like n=1 Tax=Littorina saxatilis TaxID=31220 RepID=UPI0038B46B8D
MDAENVTRFNQPTVQFSEPFDRSPIIVTKEDTILLWRSVGASKGLVVDVDIARFLLTLYHIKRDLADSLCVQCHSPLTLFCPKCQLLSQHTTSTPQAACQVPPSYQAPSSHHSESSHQDEPSHQGKSSNQAACQVPPSYQAPSSHQSKSSHQDKSSRQAESSPLLSAHQQQSPQHSQPATPSSGTASLLVAPTETPLQVAPFSRSHQTSHSEKEPSDSYSDSTEPILDISSTAEIKSSEKKKVGRPKKVKKTNKPPNSNRNKDTNNQNTAENVSIVDGREKLSPKKRHASSAKEPYLTVEEFMAEACAGAAEAVTSKTEPTRKSWRVVRKQRLKNRSRKDGQFECSLCDEKFKKKREQQRHVNARHKYHCRYCPETFSTMEEKRVHKKLIHKIPFACPDCGKEFSSRRDLLKHAPVHTQKKGFPCSKCDYVGRSEKLLTRHMDTHEEKRHQCEFCGVNFCTRSYLADHVQQHTGKQFTCTDCGATFARPFNLRVHCMKHAGLKPFVCSLCGKSFSHKFSLTLHLRIHSDNRPYACEFCPAKFKRRDYLTKHRRLHTGERPYRCKVCLKTFIEVTVMKKHQKRCHPERGLISETAHLPETTQDHQTVNQSVSFA